MKEKEATRGLKAKKEEQALKADNDDGFAELSSGERW
jgi:hypothetical protein